MKTIRILLASFLILGIAAMLAAPASAATRIRPLDDWFVNNGAFPASLGWYSPDYYLLFSSNTPTYTGFVRETDLPDGRVEVTVKIHASNVPFRVDPGNIIEDGLGKYMAVFKFYMTGPNLELPAINTIPESNWVYMNLTFKGSDDNFLVKAQFIGKPQIPAGIDSWPVEQIILIPKQ